MELLNFILGIVGIFLSGHSVEKAIRDRQAKYYLIGAIEFISGIYFLLAYIGNLTT